MGRDRTVVRRERASTLAFVNDGPGDGTEILGVAPDSSRRRLDRDDRVVHRSRSWSPHGRSLAYVATDLAGEAPTIFVVDSDPGAGPARQVARGDRPVSGPHGERLAYEDRTGALVVVQVHIDL